MKEAGSRVAMTMDGAIRSWDFRQTMPAGSVAVSYQLSADHLQVVTDSSLGEKTTDTVGWAQIAEAATVVIGLPGSPTGRPAALPTGASAEWLLVSRSDGVSPALMRPLPPDEERGLFVSELRQRLGPRFVGERLPLEQVSQRFRLSAGTGTLKVFGLVAAVLALVVAIFVAGVLLTAVLLYPVVFAFGSWLFHRGLTGLRDALAVRNTPTSRIGAAAIGLVEIEGQIVCDVPVAAGLSGLPSAWWDARIEAWYEDSDGSGSWKQVAAFHGGACAVMTVRDDTGSVPVWLRDADLFLDEQSWRSGSEALPAAGQALVAGAGIDWSGSRDLRAIEIRMPADAQVHVLGTLDEAGRLSRHRESVLSTLRRSLQSGGWKQSVVDHTPRLARLPLTVALEFFSMFFRLGRSGERATRAVDSPPPVLAPDVEVIWKGLSGRPFMVSSTHETAALDRMRQRALWSLFIGAAMMCWVLYEIFSSP